MDLLLKQEEIAGTVLEEVANVTAEEIAVAKADLADSHVRKEDKVFGPMTELEKRIFAVIVKKTNELKEKSPLGSSPVFDMLAGMFGFMLSLDQKGADGINFEELSALKRDIEFLKSWMAYVIPGRLGIKENFVLRAGFQIALLKEKEDEDDDSCKTENQEAENELCAECPYRDICPGSSYKTTEE